MLNNYYFLQFLVEFEHINDRYRIYNGNLSDFLDTTTRSSLGFFADATNVKDGEQTHPKALRLQIYFSRPYTKKVVANFPPFAALFSLQPMS